MGVVDAGEQEGEIVGSDALGRIGGTVGREADAVCGQPGADIAPSLGDVQRNPSETLPSEVSTRWALATPGVAARWSPAACAPEPRNVARPP